MYIYTNTTHTHNFKNLGRFLNIKFFLDLKNYPFYLYHFKQNFWIIGITVFCCVFFPSKYHLAVLLMLVTNSAPSASAFQVCHNIWLNSFLFIWLPALIPFVFSINIRTILFEFYHIFLLICHYYFLFHSKVKSTPF